MPYRVPGGCDAKTYTPLLSVVVDCIVSPRTSTNLTVTPANGTSPATHGSFTCPVIPTSVGLDVGDDVILGETDGLNDGHSG